jgi:hypothetical protein
MSNPQLDEQVLNFLTEDYKTKIQHLEGHYGRMWSRFNYFLTIQTGLFILLFSQSAGVELSRCSLLLTPIGITWCVLWYMFGAQDRYSVAIQRRNIEHTAEQIYTKLNLSHQYYAGQTSNMKDLGVPANFYQWRIGVLSISKLVAMCPVFVLLIWIFVFVLTRNG